MAQLPTVEDIAKAREETRIAFEVKQEEQLAQGKGFNVPADGHGAGVVPEKLWGKVKL